MKNKQIKKTTHELPEAEKTNRCFQKDSRTAGSGRVCITCVCRPAGAEPGQSGSLGLDLGLVSPERVNSRKREKTLQSLPHPEAGTTSSSCLPPATVGSAGHGTEPDPDGFPAGSRNVRTTCLLGVFPVFSLNWDQEQEEEKEEKVTRQLPRLKAEPEVPPPPRRHSPELRNSLTRG